MRRWASAADHLVKSQVASLGGSSVPHLRQPDLTPPRSFSIPTLNSPQPLRSSLVQGRKVELGAEGRSPQFWGEELPLNIKSPFLPCLIARESSNLPRKCTDTKKFLHVSIHSPVHTSG